MNSSIENSNNYLEKKETINENLLLNALKNCDPFILPGTIKMHKKELLSLLNNNVFSYSNLIDYLTTIAKLRTQLDQENARTSDETFNEITKTLTVLIDKTNELVQYNLLPNPTLILEVRFQIYTLLKQLSTSGYPKNITDRVEKNLQNYLNLRAKQSYKHTDVFLQGTLKKLTTIINTFNPKNIFPFTNELSKQFNISLY